MRSKFEYLIESQDDYKNTGYEYKGNILKNSISSYIYFNEKLQPMFLKLEEMIGFMFEQAKYIKKHYNYTIRKNNSKFN
jgi:hypothetical protein